MQEKGEEQNGMNTKVLQKKKKEISGPREKGKLGMQRGIGKKRTLLMVGRWCGRAKDTN